MWALARSCKTSKVFIHHLQPVSKQSFLTGYYVRGQGLYMGKGQSSLGSESKVTWVISNLKVVILADELTATSSYQSINSVRTNGPTLCHTVWLPYAPEYMYVEKQNTGAYGSHTIRHIVGPARRGLRRTAQAPGRNQARTSDLLVRQHTD